MEDRLERLKQRTNMMKVVNDNKPNDNNTGQSNVFGATRGSFASTVQQHRSSVYESRADDIQSTQSSVVMREADQIPQRSLADELKARRIIKDRITVERRSVQMNQAEEEIDSPPLGMSTHYSRQIPRQTDSSGSAYRIRPQTPKINLLNKNKQ